MSINRARLHAICDGVTLIDDAGESTCYLVCGQERALLIDTANGQEDLLQVVRGITPLPITVVDTHGHPDHVAGNRYFGGAYLHPADLPVIAPFLAEEDRVPLTPVLPGDVFDLGGVRVEVVDLHGHTPGSIGLIDDRHRLLFSGDAVNPHLWMQLDHSMPIRALREMLAALIRDHGSRFDSILHGHATAPLPASWLDTLLRGCEELLAGDTANDTPYRWFGGECLQHPLTEVPGQVIVYTKDKL